MHTLASATIARVKAIRNVAARILRRARGNSFISSSRCFRSIVATWTTNVRAIAGCRSLKVSFERMKSSPRQPPLVLIRPCLAAIPRSTTNSESTAMYSERQKTRVRSVRAAEARNSTSMSSPLK